MNVILIPSLWISLKKLILPTYMTLLINSHFDNMLHHVLHNIGNMKLYMVCQFSLQGLNQQSHTLWRYGKVIHWIANNLNVHKHQKVKM